MALPWWWRYALPNIVTSISMVASLLSVASSIAGDFYNASWLILLSVLLDKADGTVARLVKGSSTFGLQMDSFADLLAFGVAPGLLVLALGKEKIAAGTPFVDHQSLFLIFAYIGSFAYIIATILRLAKFNVVSEHYGNEFFFGFPSTICGTLISSGYLVLTNYAPLKPYLPLMPIFMVLLAFLMVSNIPVPKVKMAPSIPGKIWVIGNMIAVYTCGIFRLFPEYLLGLAIFYLTVGPILAIAKGVKAPPLPRPDGSAV